MERCGFPMGCNPSCDAVCATLLHPSEPALAAAVVEQLRARELAQSCAACTMNASKERPPSRCLQAGWPRFTSRLGCFRGEVEPRSGGGLCPIAKGRPTA